MRVAKTETSFASAKSTPAKFTSGYSFASDVRSSLNMNPTPRTRARRSEASRRSPASRSEPSPGSMNWTRASRYFEALSAPMNAPSLNDLSPRPPMSKTTPMDGPVPAATRDGALAGWTKSSAPWTRVRTARAASSGRMSGERSSARMGAASECAKAGPRRLRRVDAPSAAHMLWHRSYQTSR